MAKQACRAVRKRGLGRWVVARRDLRLLTALLTALLAALLTAFLT